MPGVLILEALAQAGGIMVMVGLQQSIDSKICLFTGIDKVRFRRSVVPGDRLDLFCVLLRNRLNLWKLNCTASVEGKVAAEGELTAALLDREDA
jgi:3-hydroxyacyl-[acyl-carrier-protein] dehydratase